MQQQHFDCKEKIVCSANEHPTLRDQVNTIRKLTARKGGEGAGDAHHDNLVGAPRGPMIHPRKGGVHSVCEFQGGEHSSTEDLPDEERNNKSDDRFSSPVDPPRGHIIFRYPGSQVVFDNKDVLQSENIPILGTHKHL